MNKEIMRAMGFHREAELVELGKCPWCAQTVDLEKFRDEKSLVEFDISGLCQTCQDGFFNQEG